MVRNPLLQYSITPIFSWPIPVMDASLIAELDKTGFMARLSEGR